MPTPTPAPPRRVDGSMSLLVDTMRDTLDPAYAERAARRAGAPPPGTGRQALRLGTTALVLMALGLVTGTAVAQVRERSAAGSGLRAELADEVRDRTDATDALAVQAQRLRDQVAAEQEALLGADAAGRAAAARLAALGLASGTVPVRGPGVVVRLDDAPAGEQDGEDPLRGGTAVDGRVQDRDLQDLVNALWAAGAEAVSIDDQRLTTLTAIRSAGDAVLVDFRPLSPPYEVRAVGDPGDLELELLDGPTGRRLATYTSLYGIVFEVQRDDDLELPGAATPDLRDARPQEAR